MKRYPSEHPGTHTAPGRCVELLKRSQARQGVVLDLGCGRAPLADQVRELGLDYVGADVNEAALAEVSERGYEVHPLDLRGSAEELSRSLRAIVADRPVAAILVVDVLEHLIEPAALLEAARGLADAELPSLIVSVPHIAHYDIAAKLLMGRWDLTEFGLLDDTHLRFFSERLFSELFRATGWRLKEADDIVSPLSDQQFPVDSPLLRPGTPAGDLLRRIGADAHPRTATYQFVRRFGPGEVAEGERHRWPLPREQDKERIFASVLVRPGRAGLQRMLADLEAQSTGDFETIVIREGSDRSLNLPDNVRFVDAAASGDPWNAGLAAAEGRYLCFLDETARVGREWVEAFERPSTLAGHVLRADLSVVSDLQLGGDEAAEGMIASGQPLDANDLDLMRFGEPGPIVLSAYAVPLEAVRTTGLRFETGHGAAAAAIFLSRAAELCGIHPVGEVTVATSERHLGQIEAQLDAVAESFDEYPIVLPAGSATRIVAMRRALLGMQESLSWRVTSPLRVLRRGKGGG